MTVELVIKVSMMQKYNSIFFVEKGVALIIMVLILALLVTTYLISNLQNMGLKASRQDKTMLALQEAKATLIGYSLISKTMPGSLPCPDTTTNDGVKGTCSASKYIGRFPWKTLGYGDVRDGNAECLWYALSPAFRDTIPTASRNATNSLNSNTSGTITIKNANGVTIASGVIAVIISPGSTLLGQSRAGLSTQLCSGSTTATPSNYLDSLSGINNATGNISGNNLTFVSAQEISNFNDRIVYVTQEDLYKPLRKRIVREIMGKVEIPAGLYRYFQTSASYPFPSSTVAGGQNPGLTNGYVPYTDAAMQYALLGNWLANNGWFNLTNFIYTSSTKVTISVGGGAGVVKNCTANSSNILCD